MLSLRPSFSTAALFFLFAITPLTVAAEEVVVFHIEADGLVHEVVIQLEPEATPLTSRNFRQNVSRSLYDGLAVHRVIPHGLVQMGDPLSTNAQRRGEWGTGDPGYRVPAELGGTHRRGSVAMARLGDDINPRRSSNGSQFYICLTDLPDLDGKYTVFGKVISGMAGLDQMAELPRDANDNPMSRITIQRARLVEAQKKAPAPQPESAPTPQNSRPEPSQAPATTIAEDDAPAAPKKRSWITRFW